jgi:hypothetical protein
VTVEWRKLVKQGSDVTAGPNVIPSAYAQPQSTPLKVTVGTAPNALDPIRIEKVTKVAKKTRRIEE